MRATMSWVRARAAWPSARAHVYALRRVRPHHGQPHRRGREGAQSARARARALALAAVCAASATRFSPARRRRTQLQKGAPEIVLVRKTFPNRKNRQRRRKWELRRLDIEQADRKRVEAKRVEEDYESFMRVRARAPRVQTMCMCCECTACAHIVSV